jgi:predicted PurR-regulated permease PerM
MPFQAQHKKWVFVLLFLLLLTLSIFIIKDYLSAIFVGALITYFLYPLYTKLQKRVGSRRLAQFILALLSFAVVLILLAAIVVPLAQQAFTIYDQSDEFIELYTNELEKCATSTAPVCTLIQKAENSLSGVDLTARLEGILQKASAFLFSSLRGLVSGAFSLVLFFVVMVFSIFYFLDHGQDIKKTVIDILPLEKRYKQRIFDRLQETIRAVVGGNITAAILQGVIGAVLFFFFGVPLALFWGLVMAILAFIPAIGPTLIWLPAVVILIVQGSVVKGVLLGVLSLVLLGYIDNFLKPKLIGNKIKLSSFWILLGVLGGLQVFGILGLFFGPIILALLVTFVQMYQEF